MQRVQKQQEGSHEDRAVCGLLSSVLLFRFLLHTQRGWGVGRMFCPSEEARAGPHSQGRTHCRLPCLSPGPPPLPWASGYSVSSLHHNLPAGHLSRPSTGCEPEETPSQGTCRSRAGPGHSRPTALGFTQVLALPAVCVHLCARGCARVYPFLRQKIQR